MPKVAIFITLAPSSPFYAPQAHTHFAGIRGSAHTSLPFIIVLLCNLDDGTHEQLTQ